MSDDLFPSLSAKCSSLEKRESSDFPAFNCAPADLVELCRVLRDEYRFDQLMDVSGVDWDQADPRFTVVYHLYSTERHDYVRLAVNCESPEAPAVPSLVSIWPAADWHERETYDMFGIRFEGHPDLRRILMWDEYPYYPLRKDFPLAGIDTDLPGEDVAEKTGARLTPAPMMGGPFTAKQAPHMSKREPRAKDQSWTERNPKPD